MSSLSLWYKRHTSAINLALVVVIIVLLALMAAPYLVARTAQSSGDMNMSMGMMQQLYPLDTTGAAIPTVSFTLTAGAPDGWYLHITTTNFIWDPAHINGAPLPDDGHAHLYIDGTLYVILGPWYHIDPSAMPPGKHTVTVSLNANDHSEFADGGKGIEFTQTFYTY